MIASDVWLSSDRRHIGLKSADKELIEKFKTALGVKNKIGIIKQKNNQKRHFYISIGDIIFYKFLNEIGLSVAKSKTITKVVVPDEFFADFLRGLFNGDGTSYTFWDTRWPNSFAFKIAFASASAMFIQWLKERLSQFYGVKGYTHKGDGILNLEYSKGDTKKLFVAMYYRNGLLYLNRKYRKLKSAFRKDKILGLAYLQKQRNPLPSIYMPHSEIGL